MKKNIVWALAISGFFAVTLNSCELLGDCSTCNQVTYENGFEVASTPGILYCGDELAEKESEDPVTIGSRTTYWECN